MTKANSDIITTHTNGYGCRVEIYDSFITTTLFSDDLTPADVVSTGNKMYTTTTILRLISRSSLFPVTIWGIHKHRISETNGFVRLDGDPSLVYDFNDTKTNELGILTNDLTNIPAFFNTAIGTVPEEITDALNPLDTTDLHVQ